MELSRAINEECDAVGDLSKFGELGGPGFRNAERDLHRFAHKYFQVKPELYPVKTLVKSKRGLMKEIELWLLCPHEFLFFCYRRNPAATLSMLGQPGFR